MYGYIMHSETISSCQSAATSETDSRKQSRGKYQTFNPLKCGGVRQLHLKVFNAIQV